jgi:hypothetical protein
VKEVHHRLKVGLVPWFLQSRPCCTGETSRRTGL